MLKRTEQIVQGKGSGRSGEKSRDGEQSTMADTRGNTTSGTNATDE